MRKQRWFRVSRFVVTTFLVAFALTAFADTQPGTHNAPAVDWVIIGALVACVRLMYRYAIRRWRARGATP